MKSPTPAIRQALAATATLAVLSVLVSGCSAGLGSSSYSVPVKASPVTITGHVHGGQQPISGAVIQLYAVGITGLKSASTPLIAATVKSDANGSFSITNDWDCTSNTAAYGNNPLLYIVASGGNPGISINTNNVAINLVAALGPCSGVNASTVISMNELTTVAAVYALAPFMADVVHVGATGNEATGLVNAFNTAALLVNTSTGLAPGRTPSTATAPTTELNALADVLSTCVNSTGSDGSCATLFAAATPANGIAPTDVAGVVINIAANPSMNSPSLFKMINADAPFQPMLTAAPNDWSVAIKFTGGGLSAPAALALDAGGNVWVANAGGNSVTELSSAGMFLTGGSGYSGNGQVLGAQGIAVDRAGNIWLADTLLDSAVRLSVAGGAIQSSTSFSAGGISGPIGIAVDSQNDVWIANFAGASVTELNSSGTLLGANSLTANGQLQAPTAIAVDSAGNVWVTDHTASDVVEFNNNQALLSGIGDTDTAIRAPQGIAVDTGGRAWTSYQGTNAVGWFSQSSNGLTSAPYTGGGLVQPSAVAIDGRGTVWVANDQAAGSLSELSLSQPTPLSPATGLGSLNAPSGIAVDASGSIWTANSGDNSVSEFVGIASPVTTPLAANVGP